VKLTVFDFTNQVGTAFYQCGYNVSLNHAVIVSQGITEFLSGLLHNTAEVSIDRGPTIDCIEVAEFEAQAALKAAAGS
jgi:hypothetical protein